MGWRTAILVRSLSPPAPRKHCQSNYGFTWNTTLLLNVPLGVVTSSVPVVAPTGTVVLIAVFLDTVNVAGVPLKVTLVVPVRPFPRIRTLAPTVPAVGTDCTNRARPTDSWKTVPMLLAPPPWVTP